MGKRTKIHMPLVYVVGFNLLTLVLFFTAPFQWKTENLFLFAFLSLFSQFLIVKGFKKGFNKGEKTYNTKVVFNQFTNKKINFIFIFYAITFLIKYAYLLKFMPYEISEMFNFLLVGFFDPQLGYKLSLDTTRQITLPWSLFFIISIINQVFFIVGFLSWKNINKIKRFFFIVFIILEIFFWMGRGTNFGVIILITTFLLSTMYQSKIQEINFKRLAKNYILLLLLVVVSISFFSRNMTKRAGDNDLNIQSLELGQSIINENSMAFSLIPKDFHQTYMYVVLYVTQGYYHTCIAFDLDYKPTYLLTNNPALIDFSDILGLNFYEDSYVYRLKNKGVDPEINWHSSYTWFASDLSFFGVPFLFFFIGYLFGFSWYLGYSKNDFLSKIIFVLLGNSLFYIFANNNYLSSVFYSIIVFLPIWYFTRIKRFF
jgi:hypothetical protein